MTHWLLQTGNSPGSNPGSVRWEHSWLLGGRTFAGAGARWPARSKGSRSHRRSHLLDDEDHRPRRGRSQTFCFVFAKWEEACLFFVVYIYALVVAVVFKFNLRWLAGGKEFPLDPQKSDVISIAPLFTEKRNACKYISVIALSVANILFDKGALGFSKHKWAPKSRTNCCSPNGFFVVVVFIVVALWL